MTTEWGMNLAGVERVFELEDQLDRMQRKVAMLERRAEQLQEEIARLEEKRESVKAEIVRYEAAPGDLTDPYSARQENEGEDIPSAPPRSVREMKAGHPLRPTPIIRP